MGGTRGEETLQHYTLDESEAVMDVLQHIGSATLGSANQCAFVRYEASHRSGSTLSQLQNHLFEADELTSEAALWSIVSGVV